MAKPRADIKNRGGRPATGIRPAVLVRIDTAIRKRIERWKNKIDPDISEPEAIRRLISIALDKEE